MMYKKWIRPFPKWFMMTSFCVRALVGGNATDFPIRDLVAKADVILIGSIADDVQAPGAVTLTIGIDRVIKGNSVLGSRITVRYNFPASYRGPRNVSKRRGLFFLRSSGSGAWELLPAAVGQPYFESLYYPIATAGTTSIYGYSDNTPVIDK